MTNEEKAKAREREARVAELAKLVWVHMDDLYNIRGAFSYAELFDDFRQARWEALK